MRWFINEHLIILCVILYIVQEKLPVPKFHFPSSLSFTRSNKTVSSPVVLVALYLPVIRYSTLTPRNLAITNAESTVGITPFAIQPLNVYGDKPMASAARIWVIPFFLIRFFIRFQNSFTSIITIYGITGEIPTKKCLNCTFLCLNGTFLAMNDDLPANDSGIRITIFWTGWRLPYRTSIINVLKAR